MDYWKKQTKDKPLFEDLLWSKPENKAHAGKLLIIGGNLHGFSAPATAYQEATNTGIGTAKVLLPNALQKAVGRILENGEYAPSTPSGSFSKQSLAEWLDWTTWADGVLLAGDFGRNSETAITLEQYLQKTDSPLTLTKDAIEYFNNQASKLFERKDTTIVVTIAQLQKLCTNLGWTKPVTFSMTLVQLVEFLHEISTKYPCNIIVKHNDIFFVAAGGQVSTTPTAATESWRVQTASKASVWWIQNPTESFKALTTSQISG